MVNYKNKYLKYKLKYLKKKGGMDLWNFLKKYEDVTTYKKTSHNTIQHLHNFSIKPRMYIRGGSSSSSSSSLEGEVWVPFDDEGDFINDLEHQPESTEKKLTVYKAPEKKRNRLSEIRKEQIQSNINQNLEILAENIEFYGSTQEDILRSKRITNSIILNKNLTDALEDQSVFAITSEEHLTNLLPIKYHREASSCNKEDIKQKLIEMGDSESYQIDNNWQNLNCNNIMNGRWISNDVFKALFRIGSISQYGEIFLVQKNNQEQSEEHSSNCFYVCKTQLINEPNTIENSVNNSKVVSKANLNKEFTIASYLSDTLPNNFLNILGIFNCDNIIKSAYKNNLLNYICFHIINNVKRFQVLEHEMVRQYHDLLLKTSPDIFEKIVWLEELITDVEKFNDDEVLQNIYKIPSFNIEGGLIFSELGIGDFKQILKNWTLTNEHMFNLYDICKYLIQFLYSTYKMHGLGYVHGDLHAGNVIVLNRNTNINNFTKRNFIGALHDFGMSYESFDNDSIVNDYKVLNHQIRKLWRDLELNAKWEYPDGPDDLEIFYGPTKLGSDSLLDIIYYLFLKHFIFTTDDDDILLEQSWKTISKNNIITKLKADAPYRYITSVISHSFKHMIVSSANLTTNIGNINLLFFGTVINHDMLEVLPAEYEHEDFIDIINRYIGNPSITISSIYLGDLKVTNFSDIKDTLTIDDTLTINVIDSDLLGKIGNLWNEILIECYEKDDIIKNIQSWNNDDMDWFININ